MSDDQTPQIDLESDDLEPSSDNFTRLRNAYKEKSSALKAAEKKLETIEPNYRTLLVKEAGLPPDSPQAKALLELHKGDLTVEALTETAKTYGLTVGDQAEKPTLTDEQQAAVTSSQTDQQLAAVSTPVEPQDLDARIADAEANKDWKTSMALKQQKLAKVPVS